MTQFSTLYGARLDEELGSQDSTVLFTTARRKAAINQGQEEFARLTKCCVRHSTLTIASTASEYDLVDATTFPNADFVEWASDPVEFRYTDLAGIVTVLAGSDLPRRDVPWLSRSIPGWQVSTVAAGTEQMPMLWYDAVRGPHHYLGFYPAPSSGSSASMEAHLFYIARPAPMTSDTAEPFTFSSSVRTDLRPFHKALPHYAAYQLEKLRKDPEASDRQYQRFLVYVTQWLQDQRRRGGSVVTYARNYFRRRDGSWWQDDPRR